MNAYDSLMRVRLLMGYKVGVPLNEQSVDKGDGSASFEKNTERYNELPKLTYKIDNYWKLTDVNSEILKLIEILKEFEKVNNSNYLEYNQFNLSQIKNAFFKDKTLVDSPCGSQNPTPSSLIFDNLYFKWLQKIDPNGGHYKSNCLRATDPMFKFTQNIESVKQGVEKVQSYTKPKDSIEDAKNEFNLVMSKIPSDYYLLPIFNYFENNPFSTSEENSQFRKWFNTRFPKTARLINLDNTDKSKQNKYTTALKSAVNQIIDYGRESIFAFYVYDNLAKKDKNKYIEWWNYFSPKMMQTGEIMNKINEQKKMFIDKTTLSKSSDSLNERLQLLWEFGNQAEKEGITTNIYPSNDWTVDIQWDWMTMQSKVYLQYKPTSEKCGFKIQVNYTKQVTDANFIEQSFGMENEEVNEKYVATFDFKVNGNIVEVFSNGKKVTGTYWKEGNDVKVLFPGYPKTEDLKISSLKFLLERLDLMPDDTKIKNKAEELYNKSQEQWNIRQQAIAMGSNVSIEGDLSLNPCYPAFQKKLDELKSQGKDINKKEVRVDAWTEFVKCVESGLTGDEYNKNEEVESTSQTLETLLKNRYVIKNWTDDDAINKDSHGAYSEDEVKEAWDENGKKGKDFLINVSKGKQYTQSANPKIIGRVYIDNKTGKYFIPWENIPTGGEGSPWVYRFYDANPIISQIIPSILAAVFTGSLAAPAATRVILYAALESGINIGAGYLDWKTGNIGDDYMYIYVDIIFAILPVVIALPSVQSLLHGKFNAYSVDSLAKKIASDIKPGTPREVIEYYIKHMLTAEERQVLAYVCKYEQGSLFREWAKQGKFGESMKKLKELYGDPPKLPKSIFDDLFNKVSKTVKDVPVKKVYGNAKEFLINLSPMVSMSKDLALLFKLGYCIIADWKDSLGCFQNDLTEDEKQKTLSLISQIGEDEFNRLIGEKKYRDISEKIIDLYGEGSLGSYTKKDKDGNEILPDGTKIDDVFNEIDSTLKKIKDKDNKYCQYKDYLEEWDEYKMYLEKNKELYDYGFCSKDSKYHYILKNNQTISNTTTTTTTKNLNDIVE